MSRINDNGVCAGFDQSDRPVIACLTDRRCGGYSEATFFIFTGIWKVLGLVHIFDGNQAHAVIGIIDDQKPLDTVFVQERPRL